MTEKIFLPWGKEQVSFELPKGWKVEGSYEPACIPRAAESRIRS